MIKTFRCRDAEALFNRERTRKFGADIERSAFRKLLMIDAASILDSLKVPPGNRLEALKGERKEQHSIRINAQWRVCFVWRDGHAYDVEIVDYH
ncbi:MAG TPA: type II toxin-antitoxin system RelE/ParE family toxin [Dongiaceae bacterium]|nr:type II toxin-antitoxin system RelE/ParE family toxin [Dongiaceae bacterium]